jgi:hypothetical protein
LCDKAKAALAGVGTNGKLLAALETTADTKMREKARDMLMNATNSGRLAAAVQEATMPQVDAAQDGGLRTAVSDVQTEARDILLSKASDILVDAHAKGNLMAVLRDVANSSLHAQRTEAPEIGLRVQARDVMVDAARSGDLVAALKDLIADLPQVSGMISQSCGLVAPPNLVDDRPRTGASDRPATGASVRFSPTSSCAHSVLADDMATDMVSGLIDGRSRVGTAERPTTGASAPLFSPTSSCAHSVLGDAIATDMFSDAVGRMSLMSGSSREEEPSSSNLHRRAQQLLAEAATDGSILLAIDHALSAEDDLALTLL